jgi:hypothetical protein
VTDRFPSNADETDQDPDAEPSSPTEDSPLSIQEIGSASRSCLVIIVLTVVIILLICLSLVVRLIF